jgi:murein DD-endopeptidase MepM/ murein hydrolase activator NlpD
MIKNYEKCRYRNLRKNLKNIGIKPMKENNRNTLNRRKFHLISISVLFIILSFLISINLNANNQITNNIIFDDNYTYISLIKPVISQNISYNSNLDNNNDFPMLVYRVKKNENFTTIAEKLKTDLSTIYSINNIKQDGNIIHPGQKYLILPGKKGLLHKVKKGETITDIANLYKDYGVTLRDILIENDILEEDSIREGENLFIPGASLSGNEIIERSNPKWILPIQKYRSYITSEFSRWRTIWINGRKYSGPHKGIDIANRNGVGTNIYAVRKGVVSFVGYKTGYGRVVYINHGDGYHTRYAHLSKYIVKKGQRVNQGDIIAKMGNTGRSTGPHLHFEIRYKGIAKNPKNIIRELYNIRNK